MPLFMDHHKGVEGLTADAVADAHRKYEEIQDEYGVKYPKYWSTRRRARSSASLTPRTRKRPRQYTVLRTV